MSMHEKIEHRAPRVLMAFSEAEVKALREFVRLAKAWKLGEVKTMPNTDDDQRLEAALLYDEACGLEARFARIQL